MFQLYGFMVINELIDNTLNTVSPLGELSPKSRSFSKEVGIYHDEEYDDVRLFTFYSANDGVAEPISKVTAKELLGIGDWLAKEATLIRIDNDRAAFMQKFNAEYATRLNLRQVGKMVTNGKHWLPEYIVFTLASDTRENQYKIWFADQSFRGQYDKYEIVVIPPIVNLDDFHKGKAKTLEELKDHDLVDLHKRVNRASDNKPYTYLITYQYEWIDPADKNDKIPTNWTAIVYGEAGQNADIIRDAFAEYVLANSDFSRDQWKKIIPDLFIPTEFYLSPFWTKFATENLQLKGGIHSPVVPLRDITPWAKRTMHGFEETHINAKAVIFDTIYKSIAIVACGHPMNRIVPVEFEKVWPDYCNIYTTSRDFNRLSPETQDFIMLMNKLLLEAETMTPDSEVQIGMSRVRRGDIYYISEQFKGVTYLVPLRYNFLTEISNSQPSSIRLPTLGGQGQATTESTDRVNDIINMTPIISQPGNVRGRTTTQLNPIQGSNGNGVTTGTGSTNGISGTPIDKTDGTGAATQAQSSNTRTGG